MKTMLTRVLLPAIVVCATCASLQAAQPKAVSVELLDAGAGEANDELAQRLAEAGFVIGQRKRAKAVRTASEIFHAKGYKAQALRVARSPS